MANLYPMHYALNSSSGLIEVSSHALKRKLDARIDELSALFEKEKKAVDEKDSNYLSDFRQEYNRWLNLGLRRNFRKPPEIKTAKTWHLCELINALSGAHSLRKICEVSSNCFLVSRNELDCIFNAK